MCAQTKTLKLFHLFVSYASYLSCCQFCSDNIIVNLSDMAWADENLINSQSLRSVPKAAEVFERPGQTMGDLCKIGTSRSSNRLKSGP